jgi:hypothetical protein
MPDNNELILARLSEIHADIGDFRTETTANFQRLGERATALETQVVPFFENDGGLDKVREDIESLKRVKWYSLGAIGSMGGLHFILKKLGL